MSEVYVAQWHEKSEGQISLNADSALARCGNSWQRVSMLNNPIKGLGSDYACEL